MAVWTLFYDCPCFVADKSREDGHSLLELFSISSLFLHGQYTYFSWTYTMSNSASNPFEGSVHDPSYCWIPELQWDKHKNASWNAQLKKKKFSAGQRKRRHVNFSVGKAHLAPNIGFGTFPPGVSGWRVVKHSRCVAGLGLGRLRVHHQPDSSARVCPAAYGPLL